MLTGKDWLLIFLGAGVTIPIAIVAPFISDWIKKRLSLRSRRNALRRKDALSRRLREVRRYKDDKAELRLFLVGRVLLVSLLWIAQEIVDYIVGPAANIQASAMNIMRVYDTLNVSVSITSSIGSVLGIAFLTSVLALGLRAYRVYQWVHEFDKFESGVKSELEALEAIINPVLQPA